jgi:hypothetical protein
VVSAGGGVDVVGEAGEVTTRRSAEDVIRPLLEFRWQDRGMGQMSCRSCGALRSVDYGDHETPMTEKRESCSRSCPWRIAEEWVAANAR